MSQTPVRSPGIPLIVEEDERSAYLEEVRYYSTQFGYGRDDEASLTDAGELSTVKE